MSVLQTKVFQLAGNYDAEGEASKSCNRPAKNQLEVWYSYVMGLGQSPPPKKKKKKKKNGVFIVYVMKTWLKRVKKTAKDRKVI